MTTRYEIPERGMRELLVAVLRASGGEIVIPADALRPTATREAGGTVPAVTVDHREDGTVAVTTSAPLWPIGS
jgi:hypothetical protein